MSAINICCEVREIPDQAIPYNTVTFRNHSTNPEKVRIDVNGITFTFRIEHIRQALAAVENAH